MVPDEPAVDEYPGAIMNAAKVKDRPLSSPVLWNFNGSPVPSLLEPVGLYARALGLPGKRNEDALGVLAVGREHRLFNVLSRSTGELPRPVKVLPPR